MSTADDAPVDARPPGTRIVLSGYGRTVEIDGNEPVGTVAAHAISLFEAMTDTPGPAPAGFGFTAGETAAALELAEPYSTGYDLST